MNYFVTGGAGFIGSNFVDLVLSSTTQNRIIVYDKLTYAGNIKNLGPYLNDSRLKIIVGDICDSKSLKLAMKDSEIVINFAAESHVDRSIDSADLFIKTNVQGAFNVFECARQLEIETLIQVSTDEVYGSLESDNASESFPLYPNSPYSASKASADLLARSFNKTYGMDIRITRSSNNYGKNQYPEKLIPVIIRSILSGEKIPIYGTGKNIREWIHVTDHCRAILSIIENGKSGEIYNIGGDFSLTNLELAKLVCEIAGVSENKIIHIEDRKGHDFRYGLDESKLRNLGDYSRVSLEAGLKETYEWYRDNPNWWNF